MQSFPIQTLTIKKCRRCGTQWCSERVSITEITQINFTNVKVAYCLACADSLAQESDADRSGYIRTGKRIR